MPSSLAMSLDMALLQTYSDTLSAHFWKLYVSEKYTQLSIIRGQINRSVA
jgi:hypothetical protein